MDVTADVLGPGYEAIELPMGRDAEGEVVATLVRRRGTDPSRRAVLYLHGFVDYFFQKHLADFYLDLGFDFYALDLRKHGRSLRPHQTPNYVESLSDYFPEIDEAVRIVRDVDGHDTLLLNGHSTGGLIAALWADRVQGRGLVDGLFLNSPFVDLAEPLVLRKVGAASRVRCAPASRRPRCPRACPTGIRAACTATTRASGSSTSRGSRCSGSRCGRRGWPPSAAASSGSGAAWTSTCRCWSWRRRAASARPARCWT